VIAPLAHLISGAASFRVAAIERDPAPSFGDGHEEYPFGAALGGAVDGRIRCPGGYCGRRRQDQEDQQTEDLGFRFLVPDRSAIHLGLGCTQDSDQLAGYINRSMDCVSSRGVVGLPAWLGPGGCKEDRHAFRDYVKPCRFSPGTRFYLT